MARKIAWRIAGALVIGAIGVGGAAAQDSPPAQAQDVSLSDALRLALRPDNSNLRQQHDNVEAAAGRAQEARGAFDWNVGVQGGWQLLYVPSVQNGFLTNQTSTVTSYYYQANIGRRFRNGVEVAPGVIAYPGAGATPAQTSGLTQARPMLGLKIPLLRGSGSGAADAVERGANDALRSARENQAFALQQFSQVVTATFWRCLAADRLLQEAQDAEQHSKAYTATLSKMVQKGVLEPTVAQQATANGVSMHLKVTQVQEDDSRCHRDLAYAMTGDIQEPWPQTTGDLPDIEQLRAGLDALKPAEVMALALDRRPDLNAAAETLRAAHENMRSAKDSARDQLDLHVDPDRVIVSFNKTFGNNAAKGREAEASAAEDQADLALRQLQDQVRTQVSDAIVDLRRSVSDWTALEEAEQQMETVVGDAEKRAKFGAITWADYLSAQNQLSDLRQQVVSARLAFATNLSLLRLATGTLDADQPALLAKELTTLPTP